MASDAHLDFADDRRSGAGRAIHRWFGQRGALAARVAIALTAAPELVADSSAIERLLGPDLADARQLISGVEIEGRRAALLDLCSGTGIVSEVALRLGLAPTAVDLHPVAVLISRCALVYPPLYAAADRTVVGVAKGHGWSGLANELKYWSDDVLAATKADVGSLWLDAVAAVRCAKTVRCPHCGYECPLSARTTPGIEAEATYARGLATCKQCGVSFRVRVEDLERWTPVSLIADDLSTELPAPTNVAAILASAKYPASVASRLDAAWARRRSALITYRVAVTPRQATILDSFRRSIRRARESMAEVGYAPDRIVALSVYLALAASDLVDYLCTGTSFRMRRIQPALIRGAWAPGHEFTEIGGRTLDGLWQRHTNAMSEIIEKNADLPRSVSVVSGDMTRLASEGDAFDLVVWDPPFYDNIDYDALAEPWTSFLRGVIGELDPTLRWGHIHPTTHTAPPEQFDLRLYERSLSSAAGEIMRVSRPGARLGVFWVSRAAKDLQDFIGLLQPFGFELMQTVTLRTSSLPRDMEESTPVPYFLVLRVLKQVGGPSGSMINAERLLELSSSDQRSLYAGLAEILANSWDREEVNVRLSPSLTGSLEQRLAEYAAAQPDPGELLRELGSSCLRHEAERLGFSREQLGGMGTVALARQILSRLGFSVPSAPAFSISAALHDSDRARSRLQLAVSKAEITGSGMDATDAVERALRFTIISWCTHIRGDEWRLLIEESLGKSANKLSFGDWVRLFTEIPSKVGPDNDIYRHIHRTFRAQHVAKALQSLVSLRNRIAHPEPGQDWPGLRDSLCSALTDVIYKLRRLLDEAALPIVLQPVEEIRDRFSRFRLRMLDQDEREMEFIVADTSDLTRPRIIIGSNLSPRQIDPELLDAGIIEERMGFRNS